MYYGELLGVEEGLGRVSVERLCRLGMRESLARSLVRLSKRTGHPFAVRKRRVGGRRQDAALAEIAQTGAHRVAPETVNGVDAVLALCETGFQSQRARVEAQAGQLKWVFRVERKELGPVIVDVEPYAALLRFLAQPALFDLASSVVGEAPVLGNVGVWYTPVTDAVTGGAEIHRDVNDPNRMHLIVLLRPVQPDGGPFSYFGPQVSRRVTAALQYQSGPLEDRVFEAASGGASPSQFTGAAGDVLAFDPYTCFHYGARCWGQDRLILIASYISRFAAQEERRALSRARNRRALAPQTENERLLLNV